MEDAVSQKYLTSNDEFIVHPSAEELVKWLTRNGGFFSHDVQIFYSDSQGYHVRAVRPLSSAAVASCPFSLTFSSRNLDPTQTDVLHVQSPLQQCQGKIPTHILTYLLLVEQRAKGKESPWHAYIACLPPPKGMTTPLWFAEDDEAFLAGTNLAPTARERKEELHRQWENAVKVIKDLGTASPDVFDFESLLWAATIFTSRAFISTHILPDQETIPILFPVVDILNHSTSAKVEWDFQPRNSFTLKYAEPDAIKPGDQLFNNYAPKQNGELLLGYGFCIEDNPIEQFALKLAFPSVLQEYAQETGLLKPENVPFGMPTEFLNTDLKTEQHFLRVTNHRLGRYENHVPFFRGISPAIVHLFFVQTMLKLDIEVEDINTEYPGIQIVLHVLVLLHQAIEQRCHILPYTTEQEPRNEKQRYAKMYRDGQASIIHSIRRELEAAINKVRPQDSNLFERKPILLNLTEAIMVLKAEFPKAAKTFEQGIEQHGLHDTEDESICWTLLLIIFASQTLVKPSDESLISTWLHDLFTRQPLPSLEDGIEDAETYAFIDTHLGDFLELPSPDADSTPTDVLDDIGLELPAHSSDAPGTAQRSLFTTRTENLGVRLIMWAMNVAEQELLSVSEDRVLKKCLYLRPWSAEQDDREDEKWVHEDVEMEGGK